MALGDIYEVKLFQDYGLRIQECLNVYYLRQTSVAGDSISVVSTVLDVIDPLVRAWQTTIMKTSFIEARNLFNVTDFIAQDVSSSALIGANTDSALPVHDTVTFRLIRTSRDINNGYKRYSGLGEGSVENGVINASGTIVALEALREALSAPMVDPDNEDITYDLVILKRLRHEPDEEHTKVWYTLPTTVEDAVYSNPASVLLNLFVTTQNSRKPK